jgi:hypothetical protein
VSEQSKQTGSTNPRVQAALRESLERIESLQTLLEQARQQLGEIAFLILDVGEAERLEDGRTAIKTGARQSKTKPNHPRLDAIRKKYSGDTEEGAARIGFVSQFIKPWGARGWILWSVLVFGVAVFAGMAGMLVVYLGRTAVVIDVRDPDIKVEFMATRNWITITGPREEKIVVEPGEQQLKITYPGVETLTTRFAVKKGQVRRVQVSVSDRKDKKLTVQIDGDPSN